MRRREEGGGISRGLWDIDSEKAARMVGPCLSLVERVEQAEDKIFLGIIIL